MDAQDTTAPAEHPPTPFELIGGMDTVRRIVDSFYDVMDTDPAAASLRAMHGRDLGPMRDRLTEFLTGWLGGPPLYFQRADHKCIRSAHNPYAIGEAERDAWMMCMRRALAEAGVSDDVREMVDRPLARMCEAFRNRGPGRETAAAGQL